MPIVLLLVGLILITVAYKNTFGDLFSALSSDVPGFAKWFLAVAVIGGLGYVPGLRIPSRWLLALVLMVLFMSNASAITAGFQNAASGAGSGKSAQTDPGTAYATNPTNPNISTAQIAGTSSSSTASAASSTSTAVASAVSPYDPTGVVNSFLHQAGVSAIFDAAVMGFGSVG